MIPFTVDQRGNLKAHFDTFFKHHPGIAERFHMEIANNQNEDSRCMNPSALAEFKIGKDGHDYPRLRREIKEVYAPAHKDFCYLFLIQVSMGDLLAIMSIVDDYFPLIRVKIYGTIESAIAGYLKILEHPPNYMNNQEAPVDYRDESKGLICSLSSLMDGITPELAKYIWEYPTKDDPWFKSLRDFFVTNHDVPYPTVESLTTAFEEIFFKKYHREMKVLARKFAEALFSEYQPK